MATAVATAPASNCGFWSLLLYSCTFFSLEILHSFAGMLPPFPCVTCSVVTKVATGMKDFNARAGQPQAQRDQDVSPQQQLNEQRRRRDAPPAKTSAKLPAGGPHSQPVGSPSQSNLIPYNIPMGNSSVHSTLPSSPSSRSLSPRAFVQNNPYAQADRPFGWYDSKESSILAMSLPTPQGNPLTPLGESRSGLSPPVSRNASIPGSNRASAPPAYVGMPVAPQPIALDIETFDSHDASSYTCEPASIPIHSGRSSASTSLTGHPLQSRTPHQQHPGHVLPTAAAMTASASVAPTSRNTTTSSGNSIADGCDSQDANSTQTTPTHRSPMYLSVEKSRQVVSPRRSLSATTNNQQNPNFEEQRSVIDITSPKESKPIRKYRLDGIFHVRLLTTPGVNFVPYSTVVTFDDYAQLPKGENVEDISTGLFPIFCGQLRYRMPGRHLLEAVENVIGVRPKYAFRRGAGCALLFCTSETDANRLLRSTERILFDLSGYWWVSDQNTGILQTHCSTNVDQETLKTEALPRAPLSFERASLAAAA